MRAVPIAFDHSEFVAKKQEFGVCIDCECTFGANAIDNNGKRVNNNWGVMLLDLVAANKIQ